jgi:NADH:ubiquinone oxidoreductase subunit 5 (subunit L)/multisubunit Na+/H+ antiporter MnhA subunit
MLSDFAWLVSLLPLLAALWIALKCLSGQGVGEPGERGTARVALWSLAGSLSLLLLLDLQALLTVLPGQLVFGEWLGSGDVRVNISYTLDGLGLTLATLIALICLLMLRFSVNYMHREAGYHRFFMVMSLFSGAMLLIVTAGNAVLAFVGWELAGVSSYLLIGYAYERQTAALNATRVFVTNRIGDAGFVLGIALTFLWVGSVEWPQIAAAAAQTGTLHLGVIGLGFLLAAMVKSAQVPFTPWISRALEGPTPSSAVFYGSLMVHAGIYLVIRLEPLFMQVPVLLVLLGVIGVVTALYGWLCGLVQVDIKSALIFSTVAQVGLMFLECGLGLFQLAAWHLALHAIWRAYQFLHAPAVLQLLDRPQRQAPDWLRRQPRLYTAVLHRFWLDSIADWLLLRPTQSLAQDLQDFDRRVVTRMIGLPDESGSMGSLAEWQAGRREGGDKVGRARGMAGRLMEWVAAMLYWFEEHLVLQGAGEGLKRAIDIIGNYLQQAENLLSQPRYLLLLIMATFVVIL